MDAAAAVSRGSRARTDDGSELLLPPPQSQLMVVFPGTARLLAACACALRRVLLSTSTRTARGGGDARILSGGESSGREPFGRRRDRFSRQRRDAGRSAGGDGSPAAGEEGRRPGAVRASVRSQWRKLRKYRSDGGREDVAHPCRLMRMSTLQKKVPSHYICLLVLEFLGTLLPACISSPRIHILHVAV